MDVEALRKRIDELRSSVTNAQLAMIGALSVIALVAVFWFYGWVSQPSYRVLSSGQTAEVTTQITDQLDKDGISYKLSNGGSTIMVKESDFDKAKVGVSTTPGAATIAGLELFDKQGFTTSEFQQRVDYQRALQGEITRAVLKFDGITSATVTLAIPEDRVFAKDSKPVRASVLVGSNATINSSTISSIVELVSAAVPGLDAANVTLTDTRGQVLSSSSGGPSGDDKRADQTSAYELALTAKAESMLAQVYGAGRVSVRVSADLDFDSKSTDVTTYDAASAVPVRKTTSVEVFTGSGAPPNATAGVLGGTDSSTSSDANQYRKDDVSEESVVASSVEHTTTAPGGVKSLSAAAIVDSTLDPAPDPDAIKALISAAIGAKPDRDSIVVQSVAFDEKAKSELAAAATVGASAAASPLLTYIRMGVGGVVLLLVLLFLRKSLKTTSEPVAIPAEERPAARPAIDSTVFDLNEIDARGIPSELRLLDADPDALANTLRSWVADRREVVR
jgi:flagellar M-ring protein FliF